MASLRSCTNVFALAVSVLAAAVCWPAAALGQTQVVLDESAYLRQFLSFAPPRYSPALLRTEGEKVLTKAGFDRLMRETERLLAQGPKTAGDWTEHVFHPVYANFQAATSNPPPDWAAADFDDSAWLRKRRPFQGFRAIDATLANLGQFDEWMDMGLVRACYRTRFVVNDPAAANLTVSAVFHGGARLLINGQEVARKHLPKGPLDGNTRGDDYPQKAYETGGEALRERTIETVAVQPDLLRKGVNVLAVEVFASNFHPVVLTNPRQVNWGGPTRPWAHGQLVGLTLRGAATAVESALARPAGTQVWAADVHDRIRSDDFLPAGERPGALRMVSPRNGACSAQFVCGSAQPLKALRVAPGDLKQEGGAGVIPLSAIRVQGMVPFPEDLWTMKYLGDERGLGANFPDAKALAGFAARSGGHKAWLYDQIAESLPDSLPAGASPLWLSLRVPADAAPGTYRGAVRVSADGLAEVEMPVELAVSGWRLSDPKDFRTLVGCEENPYAVARQYGLKLWSAEHFARVESCLKMLGEIGNRWVNVPVILQTEYGNRDDSLIGWKRKKDKSWEFDYSLLDRHLDLCVRHGGRPQVINFVVMQGMKNQGPAPVPGRIRFTDDGGGAPQTMDMDCGARSPQVSAAWTAFAHSLVAHMKEKKLEAAMYWGHPLESEADPELKNVLAAAEPGVAWIAGPHEMMSNGTFAKNEKFYKVVQTIRYWGNWPSFRMDQGWRSKTTHLLNPRAGGTVFALHTASLPFAYRVMPDHALAFGRSGFARVGADEWAATHFDGMTPAKWQTGVPVLFLLWPGAQGAESSARFECLREGIQETEARIFLEQAMARGQLTGGAAAKARATLKANLEETLFFQGNSIIRALEECHFGWQERSRRLYQTAAEAAGAMKE